MSKPKVKILAFAGSTRSQSWNKMLVKVAAEGARDAGAAITLADLRDYPMPLYDGDFEMHHGIPDKAKEFKSLLQDNHGFLVASPEYNGGYSAVLKNALDWASVKSTPEEMPLSVFKGKTASLMSAAPGVLGGLRGLHQLRDLLMNMNVTVLPQMQAVGRINEAFDENGVFKNPNMQERIKCLGAQTANAIYL